MTRDQPRRHDARGRAHELRRDRARAARRGPRAPGVREPVRRDGVARRGVRAITRDAAAALGDRAARRGACTSSTADAERVGDGHAARPTARGSSAAGASARDPAALDARRRRCRGTDRRRARPDLRAARARAPRARRSRRRVAFTTLVATTRERAFELADRYHDPHAAQRALDLAWTHDAGRAARAGHHARRRGACSRSSPATCSTPTRSLGAARRTSCAQPRLAAAAVGARHLGRLADRARDASTRSDGLPTLRQLLAAHRYWRRRGMTVDLVVLNTQPPTLPAGAARPASWRRCSRSSEAGMRRPAGRRVRAARATSAARTCCSCCARPRACTSRATAARSAACWSP